jgi:hypothetical protein
MTFEQEIGLEPVYGDPRWHDVARDRAPWQDRVEPAGCVDLAVDLLTQVPGDTVFEESVPDGALDVPSGPRAMHLPGRRRLRRFDGTPVVPTNVTQIFNGESRQLFWDTGTPWARIGRVALPDGTWGTAALVGRFSVVTAAHVVESFWSPGGPVNGPVTFTAAQNGGGSALGSGWVANVIGIAAWEQFVGIDGYDMAVCQLDQPFGDWLGFFGARGYVDDWEDGAYWTHVGYPWDLSPAGTRPSYEAGISVFDDDSDDYDTLELETEADGGSGQSGGPLWGRWEQGGRQIIGVLSGIEDNFAEDKNILFAGGQGLVSLVGWARSNWG